MYQTVFTTSIVGFFDGLRPYLFPSYQRTLITKTTPTILAPSYNFANIQPLHKTIPNVFRHFPTITFQYNLGLSHFIQV